MAKNNNLINKYKYMYQQTQLITPAIYASMAMALHREYGWGYERINRVFASSQQIWDEHVGNNDYMLQRCYEETGIELRLQK